MIKLKKAHIGPVAEVILRSIAVAGILTVAVCAPNALQILKPFFKKKKYSPHRAVAKSIESLVASGYVLYTKDSHGNRSLELTKKGKWESSIRNVSLTPLMNKKWDGMWRVVIFDIPNTQQKLRDELRRGMRLYGFHLLQRSVWVYPYQCDAFISILRNHLELTDDVLYMTVKTVEKSSELQKLFKL